MLSQLVIPEFDRQFRKGRIERWHKQEGELVNFGEQIFDIRVVEFDRLQKFETQDHADIEIVHAKTADWSWTIRVVSSDYGFLRKILRRSGDGCEIGDVVAELSTRADESMETDSSPKAAFRVIASVLTEPD